MAISKQPQTTMNELELFKSEALKSVANSGDCRILMIDGKAVLAERFSSPVPQASPSTDKSLMIGAVVLFGLGIIAGIQYQSNADAQKIQSLQAENLILESKISKIKDFLR